MARKAKVRFFASRNAFYTQMNGRQHRLADGPDDSNQNGPNFRAALKKYVELLEFDGARDNKSRNRVRLILELYLNHISTRRAENTVKLRREMFERFCKAFGERSVGSLCRPEIEEWLAEQSIPRVYRGRQLGWGPSTRQVALSSLSVAFRWAKKAGYLNDNPVEGIPGEMQRSLARQRLIDAELHGRILQASPPDFRVLCEALEATGARPGELASATAQAWNDEQGALVYHPERTRQEGEFRHKTARKGKPRIILFRGAALATIRELVRKHPTGLLYRTPRGRKWTTMSCVGWCRRIKEKLGLDRLELYSYRHTFATRWLQQGGSIDILADLMGNTPDTIRKHYSHLLNDVENLRSHLERVRQAVEGGQNQSATDANVAGGKPDRESA